MLWDFLEDENLGSTDQSPSASSQEKGLTARGSSYWSVVSDWGLNERHLPNGFSPTFPSKRLRNPFSTRNRNKICMCTYNTVKWHTFKADRLTQDSCATSLGHVLPKLIALICSHQKILHYSSWARSFQNCNIWVNQFCKETHPNALFWPSQFTWQIKSLPVLSHDVIGGATLFLVGFCLVYFCFILPYFWLPLKKPHIFTFSLFMTLILPLDKLPCRRLSNEHI